MTHLSAWWQLLRPAHWIKNLVCLSGLLFYQQWQHWLAACGVTAAFALISSTVYIINDLADRERDRLHPKKKHRPLASGAIIPGQAALLAVVLAASALMLAFSLNIRCGWCCSAYLVINLAYSFRLKHLPIADAFCIAFGFILRLLAGIYVLDQLPIGWLALFTFFLSLFLGFAKRRAELVALDDAGSERRPVLDHYSLSFLEGALDTSAALAIGCYALFLLLPSSLQQNPTQVVTVPLVAFMILHYRRRLTHPRYRIEPNKIIFRDITMQMTALCWLILYIVIQRSNWKWFLSFWLLASGS
jgi:4-hydroxybenzoate polyprenyltransferase